jgi:ubiquinone/menaquinone biosynthesis C-methylase UbiE/CheY-like chemotaxis protein
MLREQMDKPKTGSLLIVLAVDNDLSYLEKVQRTLRDTYTVYTTTSGLEAIQLIKTLPEVNILIVKDDLPRMKGTEFLRFLHEMFKNSSGMIKILLTDGRSNDSIADRVSCGRIDVCLARPEDPAVLRRTVNHLVAQRSHEKRTSMRVTLDGARDIRIEAGNLGDARVINLSENGMFLKTHSFFPEGAPLPLNISLPNGRQYAMSGRIVRHDLDHGGVGVEFQAMDDASRLSLLQFMADYVTIRDLSELKLRYPFLKTDDMVLFSDSYKIESFMREALRSNVEVAAVPAGAGHPEILSLVDIQPLSSCLLAGEKLNVKFKTSDLLFVSFQIGYATYNFETMISRIAADGRTLICLYPRVMFYSEKRAARRVNPLVNLNMEIHLPPPFEKTIRGKITDISPEGASFIVDSDAPAMIAGTPLESLRILEGNALLWEEKGEIRNVSRIDGDGEGRLRYGVQFGIGRKTIRATEFPKFETATGTGEKAGRAASLPIRLDREVQEDLDTLARRPPDVIRLENKLGEEIVALLNSSLPLDTRPIPVVLVPPAFGKTKEVLFALALTLVTNFRLQNLPLGVIRYDGIRRKGESHKDPEASNPPYEMVNASLSQGADDIKAVLDWIDVNPRLHASQVILVTFSLSALEARLALRDEHYRKKVQYWISCMGTPEIRHMLTRINCGLDLLEQYQLGIQHGVIPILGNLVNIDRYMEDGVMSQLATLDQARQDMRVIDIPVTWIYGEYDHWVRSEFIRDVMGIKANAEREVISIALGHNARTSEDALKMFGTITSLIHRFLDGELPEPIIPSRKSMDYMRIAEKDRVPSRKLSDRQTYWERYLIGTDDLMGFDVLTLADDYQQLMIDQAQALNLKPEDRLLDLGGGTGNFIDHLLTNGTPLPREITIADLVPHAIAQARKKLEPKIARLHEPFELEAFVLDLEMNRYNPVRRYLAGEVAGFRELVDKIENLTIQSATRIAENYSPRLHRILRGEKITPDREDWLKRTYDLPEYKTIHDFNAAARYVLGLEKEKPAYRQLIFSDNLTTRLHLPIRPGYYDKILMSFVLSYIFNPVETLVELKRIIKPGGRLVLSSVRPDADASGLFTRLAQKVESMDQKDLPEGWEKKTALASIRSFMNDAQALVELEEAGTFDFFDPERLSDHLEEAGFALLQTIETFGKPPQGFIFVAGVKNARD